MASHDWRAIVETHGPAVWRTICRIVPREHDALECYQETFRIAIQSSRTLACPAENTNWEALLKVIAVARAIDWIRRQQTQRKRLNASTDVQTLSDESGEAIRVLQDAELAERLSSAIVRLPELQAQVFLLRCVDEMSYEQIARELSLTESYVGNLLTRARQTLKRHLASDNPNQIVSEVTRKVMP